MLESVTGAISRIEEIKSHFKSARAGGTVSVAPHYEAANLKEPGEVKPYFPDYLTKQAQSKVKASVETISNYDGLINDAAQKYGLQPELLKAVIRAESGFRTNVMSGAGAKGLMQLMPSTAASLGISDPFDPAQNIDGGAKYLKRQLDAFGGDVNKALAAYNAGAGSVKKYDGVPPFRETQNYVAKVLSYRDEFANE